MSFKLERNINLQEQESWRGSYEASEKEAEIKFRNKEECPICLEEYLPGEAVISPSCGHLYHARCVENWEKQVCPMDQTPLKGILKAEFLGIKIIFSPNSQTVASLFNRYQTQINEFLELVYKEAYKNKPSSFQTLDIKDEFHIIYQQMAQDLIHVYEGTLSSVEFQTKAAELVEKFMATFAKESMGRLTSRDWDFTSLSKFKTEFARMVPFLVMDLVHRGGLQADEIGKAILFFKSIIDQFENDPKFYQIGKKLDQQFLQFHLKQIKPLSDKDQQKYISKLDKTALERLNRVSSSIPNGPTCQKIKEYSHQVMKFRGKIEMVKTAGNEIKEFTEVAVGMLIQPPVLLASLVLGFKYLLENYYGGNPLPDAMEAIPPLNATI